MKRLYALILCAVLMPYGIAATTATVTQSDWVLYRSSSIVQRGFSTEAACVAAARALNVTRTYTCRTITTVAVVFTADTPPPPPPPTGSGPALSLNPTSYAPGGYATISWKGTAPCTASAVPAYTPWSGSKQADWSQSVAPSVSTVFTLTCAEGSSSVSLTVTGSTPPPPPPADSDGDGVPDSSDACPTVAANTANGCPATPPSPPVDTDGDGVPDSTDQCINEPAPTPNGCPTAPPPTGSDDFRPFNPNDPADGPLLTKYAGPALAADITVYEPWLFDRASAAYIFWKRTGSATWKTEWERLFAIYRSRIDSSGEFNLKPDDTKYIYTRPFYYYEKETGSTAYRAIALRIHNRWISEWPNDWNPNKNFWTEREIGLALDAAIFYHRISGDAASLDRARALVAQWGAASTQTGAPLHTLAQHGEEFDNAYASMKMTSPWMSALYFQALREYYKITGDSAALQQVSRYADFMHQYGIVDGSAFHPNYAGVKVPYYLFGIGTFYDRETPSEADAEHCLDVGGIFRWAIDAKTTLGQSTADATTRYNQMQSCAARRFTETGSQPPRKWNWWTRGTL